MELTDGSGSSYDFLLVCVGARSRPAFRRAITFQARGEPLSIDELLTGKGGSARKVKSAPLIGLWESRQ